MPNPVYFEIPTYANDGFRWAVVSITLAVSLGILGFLLPRVPRFLRAISGQPAGVIAILGLFFIAFLGVGFLCLIFFLGAIANPITTITTDGVVQEGIVGGDPTSVAWGEVAHVNCRANHDGTVVGIGIVATDGRRVVFNNNYFHDLGPVLDLLRKQLGSTVAHRCISTNR